MRILLIVMALLFAPLASPTPDQCAEINQLLGGETIPWLDDGNGYGYWDLPEDLTRTAKIDFEGDGGLWMYEAASQPGTRWYWWFFDYEPTTDANGAHFGMHNFCAVVVSD